MLRGKHPPPLGAPLAPAAAVSALRLLGRPRRGPDPCLLVPPAQTAMLDAGLRRAPTHSHLPQSWAGAPGASGVSVQPASDSREQPEQLPQTEAAQGGAEGSPPRLESGTAALPPQGLHLSPPLATGRPAGALPAHEDPGEVPESLPAGGTSAGSVRRPVSPTPGTSLPSARAAAVQWGHLQALQQQLQLQKATLRRRQHAQEQLLLHRQKELEGWAGLPLTSLHLHASLPSARAGPGRVQEPDPAQIDAALPSGHPEAPQAQETCVGPLQPAEPEQAHPRPLPGPTGPQGRDLQAGREARTQQEADSGHWCGQARAWAFSSLPPTSMPSGKSQEQSLSEWGKGPPSGQASEGALWPLQRSLKLLQERLAAQRAALWGRPEACTGALSGGGETGLVTAHADAEPGRTGFGPPAERRAGPWGDPWTLPSQGASPGLLQQGSLSTPQEPALAQRAALGAGREPGELARSPPACTRPASTTAGLSTSAGGPSAVAPGHAEMVSLPGGLQGPSRPVPPLQGAPREPQAWPGAEGAAALHLSQDAQGHVSAEHTRHTGWCPPPSTQAPFTAPLPAAGPSAPWAPLWAEGSGGEPASRGQSPQLQDSLWRTSQPGQGSLQALQQRLAAQRETIIRGSEAQEGLLPEAGAEPKRLWGPCLAPSDSSTSSNPSGPPRLPGGPVGVSRAVLPQHGCRGGPQGPWSAQMRPHPCGRGAQGARPCSPPRPCEAQPVPLDHSGVKTSWQQLDAQRRTLRALDGAQEELLRCRPSELGKRVRAELGRSLPSPGLAGPDSGSHQGPRPTAALPGSPGGPALPRQVPWTVQLDSKGTAAGASEDAQADAGGGTAAERRAVERTPVLTPPPRTEEQPGRLGASSLSSEPVSRAPNGSLRRPSLAAAAPQEDLGLREHLEPQEDAARCGQRARAELPGLRQELDRRRGTLEGCSTGGWVSVHCGVAVGGGLAPAGIGAWLLATAPTFAWLPASGWNGVDTGTRSLTLRAEADRHGAQGLARADAKGHGGGWAPAHDGLVLGAAWLRGLCGPSHSVAPATLSSPRPAEAGPWGVWGRRVATGPATAAAQPAAPR
ncbi:Centrosomal protein of 295 kDa [Galemys pyrenaicus]|uniref:Centrosomal protein of 295 kDa n=1 Tax=Galemys pyrenaicus TaxID=202257 RepID=A0A8J6ANA8_GALPY|nr:Centrosomal protein of 295 kDa [Galemys pyrenaicus]